MNNLSNEQVRQRLEHLEDLNSRGVGTKVSSQQFEIACLRELLAYREAAEKPVAYSYKYAGYETCEGFQDWSDEISEESPPDWMVETGKVTDLMLLYAAPPLPVWLGVDWAAPSTHLVNDDMALAFCRAISDNPVGSDEIEEVKIGLRAALANYAAPQLPAVPDGWALVPIEPTAEMLDASWTHHGIHSPSAWRTMIAAAPKPGVK